MLTSHMHRDIIIVIKRIYNYHVLVNGFLRGHCQDDERGENKEKK